MQSRTRHQSTMLMLALAAIAALLSSTLTFAQQTASSNNLDAQLLGAADRGDTATVQSLLQQGANIEAKRSRWSGDSEETPLIVAAEGGHLQIVKLLIDRGANVNTTNKYGV